MNTSNFRKLESFTNGIGAANILLNRAFEGGFLIEGLVLYATLIDGLCRIALVLNQQIKERSSDIDVKYIYQDGEEYLSERKIHEDAFKESIIDRETYEEISELYSFRNKIIHRFLITSIEYSHLELVLCRYERMYRLLINVVYDLESKQIQDGIGMTVSGKIDTKSKKDIRNGASKKIVSRSVKRLKESLGPKLIHDYLNFSVCSERELISDDINDELEEYEEKKRIPPGFASVKGIMNLAKRRGLLQKCKCGHEKIAHILVKKLEKNKEAMNGLGSCRANGCKCIKYVSNDGTGK